MLLPESTPWWLGILIAIAFLAFHIWVVVSVWRCAPRSQSKWAVFARPIVALAVLSFVCEIYDAISAP
jgi:hypothetical protein